MEIPLLSDTITLTTSAKGLAMAMKSPPQLIIVIAAAPLRIPTFDG
jgi:hypothetical protein